MVRVNSVIGLNVGVESLGKFDFGTWMVKGTSSQ